MKLLLRADLVDFSAVGVQRRHLSLSTCCCGGRPTSPHGGMSHLRSQLLVQRGFVREDKNSKEQSARCMLA